MIIVWLMFVYDWLTTPLVHIEVQTLNLNENRPSFRTQFNYAKNGILAEERLEGTSFCTSISDTENHFLTCRCRSLILYPITIVLLLICLSRKYIFIIKRSFCHVKSNKDFIRSKRKYYISQ